MSRRTVDDLPLSDRTGTSFFRTDFAPLTRAYRRPPIWRRLWRWLCAPSPWY